MHGGGGMNQVAGQRPINRRPGKLSLWSGHQAGTFRAHLRRMDPKCIGDSLFTVKRFPTTPLPT